MRTSRPTIHRTAALAAGLLAIGAAQAFAAPPAERDLMGVRIWRTWKDVLQKHGQPTRIEVGASTGTAAGGAAAGDLGGMSGRASGAGLPGMGGMGLPGMGGATYGGGMMGGPTATMSGPPGSMGAAGGYMRAMMGGRGGMMGGGTGLLGSKGGGEDMAASAGGGGMMGGGMMGGGEGGASTDGEVTWVYEKGPLTFMFLFNKDGRVIQIQEFGYGGGSPTSRGVRLGDLVAKLYSAYGWADSTQQSGNQLTLDYTTKAHVSFQLLNQGKGMRVVGITVAQTERPAGIGPSMLQGGIGGAASGMMGGPTMGGMMGGGMSSGGRRMPGMSRRGGGMAP